jgi:hypothetical protein
MIGVSIRDFWDMTPFEFFSVIEARKQLNAAEWDQQVSLAWLNAYYQRVDKLSGRDRDKFLSTKKRKKEQTPEEMLAVIKALHASMDEEDAH